MILRLQDAGYEVWWLPGAAIWHFAPANRAKFRVNLCERFNDGQFIAIQRLKRRRKGWDRGCYRIARIVGGPLHALTHLLAALARLPLHHPKGPEHLLQASRNCGVTWGMLRHWRIFDSKRQ
jgi:GT2 family glycosyltransferase